jgi:hypothetical protein
VASRKLSHRTPSMPALRPLKGNDDTWLTWVLRPPSVVTPGLVVPEVRLVGANLTDGTLFNLNSRNFTIDGSSASALDNQVVFEDVAVQEFTFNGASGSFLVTGEDGALAAEVVHVTLVDPAASLQLTVDSKSLMSPGVLGMRVSVRDKDGGEVWNGPDSALEVSVEVSGLGTQTIVTQYGMGEAKFPVSWNLTDESVNVTFKASAVNYENKTLVSSVEASVFQSPAAIAVTGMPYYI